MNESVDLPAAGALGLVCTAAALAGALGRGSFERIEQQGGSVILGRFLMNAGYRVLQPAVRACAALRVSPATLTWLSLPPAAIAGVAAAGGHWGLAAWGLFISALFDVLDGAVARATGRASPRGAILDSVLDRYVEFFLFAGALVHYRGWPAVQCLVIAALFGSMMITYSTAKAEALRLTPPRGNMKRSDRMTLLIVGAALAPFSRRWLEPAGTCPAWPVLGAIGLIAVLANWSALVRFLSLSRQARP